MPISNINNLEPMSSVRSKLNQVIDLVGQEDSIPENELIIRSGGVLASSGVNVQDIPSRNIKRMPFTQNIILATVGSPTDQGWNGSDIASWAYAPIDVGPPVGSVNLLQYGNQTVIDVKYYDGSTLQDVELQMNGTIVWKV